MTGVFLGLLRAPKRGSGGSSHDGTPRDKADGSGEAAGALQPLLSQRKQHLLANFSWFSSSCAWL